MAEDGSTWRMSAWDNYYNNAKLSPFGTRVYVNGKLVAETVEGYNVIQNCGCPNPPCGKAKLDLSGLALSVTIAGEESVATGGIGTVVAPVIIIGGIAYTVYTNSDYFKEKANELEEALKELVGKGPYMQYRLIALNDGWFSNYDYNIPFSTSSMKLKAGDTYKIGTTGTGYRYSAKELKALGVIMVPEYFGTKLQVETVEKLKLMQYYMANWHLPPGNTKFK